MSENHLTLKEERERLIEAYELGYGAIGSFDPTKDIEGWESMDFDERSEQLSYAFEGFSQSAHYANNVLPTLRQLAGYEDSGHGTYQNPPNDEAPYLLNELVVTFIDGYYDALYGREKDHTRHIGSDLED